MLILDKPRKVGGGILCAVTVFSLAVLAVPETAVASCTNALCEDFLEFGTSSQTMSSQFASNEGFRFTNKSGNSQYLDWFTYGGGNLPAREYARSLLLGSAVPGQDDQPDRQEHRIESAGGRLLRFKLGLSGHL